jgi:rod shape-determining protein MreD
MKTFLKAPLICLVLTLFSLLLQSSVLQMMPFLSLVSPNLPLCIVIYLALFDGSTFAAVTVFLVGIIYDLHSGNLIGPWASAFLVIFGIVSALAQRLLVESSIALSLIVAVCVTIASIIYGALSVHGIQAPSRTVLVVLGEAFGSAVCMPLMVLIIRRGIEGRRRRYGASSLLR